jgi:hypothetical protein
MQVGGSPTSPPPSEDIEMKKLAGFAFALCTLVAGSVAAEVKITDSSLTKTIDCEKDPEVAIVGAMNTITISGACTKVAISGSMNVVAVASAAKLAISGSGNKVDVAAADKIAITGTGNEVVYDKGVTKKAPKIAKTGTGNTVSKKK